MKYFRSSRLAALASALVTLVSLVSGCASIHSGNYAREAPADDAQKKTTDPGKSGKRAPSRLGLIVSCRENKDLSSEYFGAVDVTFENATSKWIRIRKVDLDFGDTQLNDSVKLPVGADLSAWAAAAEQRKAISAHNTNLLLGVMAGAGAGMFALSSNPTLKTAGGVAALGGSVALSVRAIRSELNELELAKLVPSTHLLSDDFVIPPGMHAKKWIVFFTEKPRSIPYVSSFKLTYALEGGAKESLVLPFRDAGSFSSDWQDDNEALLLQRKAADDERRKGLGTGLPK